MKTRTLHHRANRGFSVIATNDEGTTFIPLSHGKNKIYVLKEAEVKLLKLANELGVKIAKEGMK